MKREFIHHVEKFINNHRKWRILEDFTSVYTQFNIRKAEAHLERCWIFTMEIFSAKIVNG